MKRFFRPNLDGKGRRVRAILSAILLLSGGLVLPRLEWAGLLLLAGGGFAAFEAFRGWCFLRACGLKTKL